MIEKIKIDFSKLIDPERARHSQGFFKTGKGEYGEGDIFLGITVPEQRNLAKKYKDISLLEIQELLNSSIHEHRLTAIFILNGQYKNNKKEIFNFYIKNTKNINNWDIIDSSAPIIAGDYLLDRDRSLLYKLARLNNLWKKRISIISTYAFIKNNQFNDTIKIAEILIKDKHDLIHKAVGWMLREVGKRDKQILIQFLNKYSKDMPRTMLRYSIEKFNYEERQYYMKR